MASEPHDANTRAAYLEGRLDSSEAQRFVAHAAACADCREVLAAFAQGMEGTAGAPSIAPSPLPAPRSWRAWRLPAAAALLVAAGGSIVVWRLAPDPLSEPPHTPSADIHLPSASPAPVPVPPPATAPPPQARPPQDLTRRRSAERRVEGKLFQLTAGEWIDVAYDPLSTLPLVEVRTAAERATLLSRLPALRPFAALGDRVTVVHDGVVYRLAAPRR
jgi:hypothetical protein